MKLHGRHATVSTVLALIFVKLSWEADVDAGYNPYDAAQKMIDLASHSWEWGTASEALLELYDPDLSVFGSSPFPGGNVPTANPSSTFALQYAQQFIDTSGQVLVSDSAVGDPASLGVSAIMLGQSNGDYLGAANRQADYILYQAPKWSNGAISQRPDVAELWADNMAMSMPFLAYLSVQTKNASLMSYTVAQCGLQRAVLQSSQSGSWQHIIGPQSQDTGLWSTGNGWAAFGMTRVLYTLQKWSGSSSMSSQASQLKGWIKEILDGAISSSTNNGLLPNYLDDSSWFGEISGTALLSAVAYRMATNDPGMFPSSKYVQWADANRKALAQHESSDGIFSPAVDPYNWLDRSQYTSGSPEGQAFGVYMYTAYRDCVAAGACTRPAQATTISNPGIGPIDILTVLEAAVTFSAMPAPTGSSCGPAPQSCDQDGCDGMFVGLSKYPTCQAGPGKGCQCVATPKTCGPSQGCDKNGCAGSFNGLGNTPYPQCTGNFVGCNCTATSNTCGPRVDCDKNGCQGSFNGLGNAQYPQCMGNFKGCNCTVNSNTCGPAQDCDKNGCAGSFNGLGNTPYPQCTGSFVGCNCTANSNTCGPHQDCDKGGCAGKFQGSEPYAQCTGNFVGCSCTANSNTCGPPQDCTYNDCNGKFLSSTPLADCTDNFIGCPCLATNVTCGPPQSCDLHGCGGKFRLDTGQAQCLGNFVGCQCAPTSNTCGPRQSCDMGNCDGKFLGNAPYASCTNFFQGCECEQSAKTCGPPQDCSMNGCAGEFDLSNGLAYCSGNFKGCQCQPNAATCGRPQACEQDNCKGGFNGNQPYPVCKGFFAGCTCSATDATCGNPQPCDRNGCAGAYDSSGVARCQGNFKGCKCTAVSSTCGNPQNCDLNGCNGAFTGASSPATCQGKFAGCPCIPVKATCGEIQSCEAGGCAGGFDAQGNAVCFNNYEGCPCVPDPIWIPAPPRPTFTQPPPSTVAAPPPPIQTCYEDCDVPRCKVLSQLCVRPNSDPDKAEGVFGCQEAAANSVGCVMGCGKAIAYQC